MFLSILFNQGDKCNNEHAKSEKLCPCNHCNHPPCFRLGVYEAYPRKGGTAYRGTVAPPTGYPIFLQLSILPAIICLCGGFQAARSVHSQKGILPAQIGNGLFPACAFRCLLVAVFSHVRSSRFWRGPPSVPKLRGCFKIREGGHSYAMRLRIPVPVCANCPKPGR